MERIGVRELRQNASRYLDRVSAGEAFEISDRGRLVALLVAPPEHATARDRLVSSGRLVPARRPRQPLRLPQRRRVAADAPTTGQALDEVRAERLR